MYLYWCCALGAVLIIPLLFPDTYFCMRGRRTVKTNKNAVVCPPKIITGSLFNKNHLAEPGIKLRNAITVAKQ